MTRGCSVSGFGQAIFYVLRYLIREKFLCVLWLEKNETGQYRYRKIIELHEESEIASLVLVVTHNLSDQPDDNACQFWNLSEMLCTYVDGPTQIQLRQQIQLESN